MKNQNPRIRYFLPIFRSKIHRTRLQLLHINIIIHTFRKGISMRETAFHFRLSPISVSFFWLLPLNSSSSMNHLIRAAGFPPRDSHRNLAIWPAVTCRAFWNIKIKLLNTQYTYYRSRRALPSCHSHTYVIEGRVKYVFYPPLLSDQICKIVRPMFWK